MKRPIVQHPEWIKKGQREFTHSQINDLGTIMALHIEEQDKYIDFLLNHK